MVGRPYVNTEWGPGFEDARASAAARKSVKESLALSLELLDAIGLQVRAKKNLKVCQPVDIRFAGEMVSKDNCVLYSRAPSLTDDLTKEAVMHEDALTIGHELAHLIRADFFYDNSCWLEDAAKEGISYNLEDEMAAVSPVLHGISTVVSEVKMLEPWDLQQRSDKLLMIAAKRALRAADLSWLQMPTTSVGLNQAEVIGISAISRAREIGAGLGELMTMPAHELVAA